MNDGTELDDVFAQLASRAGGLPQLLLAFFGFLRRRTDFYIISKPPPHRSPMGFPPGHAKKLVFDAMDKYPFTSDQSPPFDSSSSSSTSLSGRNGFTTSSSPDQTNAKVSNSSINSQSKVQLQYTDEGKQIPIGNGGVGPNYYWTQTLTEISVYVQAPLGCKAKDLNVIISHKSVRIQYIDSSILLEGDFEDVVKSEECIWTITSDSKAGASEILLTLGKARKTWWKHVILSHPEIDTSKVSSYLHNHGIWSHTVTSAGRFKSENR